MQGQQWQQQQYQMQQQMQAQQQQQQMQMQQQQAMMMQRQQAMQQQQQQAQGQPQGGGQPDQKLKIDGCNHATVGNIVRGAFTLNSENHGRPVYKKDTQVNGLDVMLYFWDERDGESFSGWWFGPKVGSDQVWAYHPDRQTKIVPKTGWKVPYDGPVDPTFVITGSGPAAPPQAQAQVGKGGWDQGQAAKGGWDQGQAAKGGWDQGQAAKGDKGGWGQAQAGKGGWDQGGGQAQAGKGGWDQSGGQGKGGWDQSGGKGGWDQSGGKGGWDQSGQQQVSAQQQAMQAQQAKLQEMRRQQEAQREAQMAQQRQAEELKRQQELAKKQAEEAHRAKMKEINLKRLEDNRAKYEERRQKEEAAKKAKEDEAKKQAELLAQKREEQRATLAIRKVVGKVRIVKEEDFEAAEKELMQCLSDELDNCGSQREKMQEEASKGLEHAKQRIAQAKEQIRLAEEKKAAAEKKFEEDKAKAEELIKELGELADEAEGTAKTFKESITAFTEDKELTLKEIEKAGKAVDGALDAAKAAGAAAQDFIMKNRAAMTVTDIAGKSTQELRENVKKLYTRLNATQADREKTHKAQVEGRSKATRKAEARKKMTDKKTAFKKYASKDGYLQKKDLVKYAKAEFKFNLTDDAADKIYKLLGADGGKGVSADLFQKIKVAVGVQREHAIDAKKKAEREKHEKMIADEKAQLTEKVEAATKVAAERETQLKEAEDKFKVLPAKSRDPAMTSAEMVKLADEIDEDLKKAKEEVTSFKESLDNIKEGVEPELKNWVLKECRGLDFKAKSMDPRITKGEQATKRFRDDAAKKNSLELRALEKQALALVHHHKRVAKVSDLELYAAIAGSEDADGVDMKKFVAFFETCEKPPKEVPQKKEEKKDESEKKDDEEEKKDDDAEKAETADEKQPAPSEEDLERLFKHLDEGDEGKLGKEMFMSFIRQYLKVIKDSCMTDGFIIKESKTLKRLETGAVVELLEGPAKEDATGCERIRAKYLSDGENTEGWITMTGNKGSDFLEPGGNVFKVVAETILTDAFELDGGDKAKTNKVKDTTRKLKKGELVDVREWPRKEEKSGLTRMKCKAKSDGAVGWVTTMGNTGTQYLVVA